VDRGANAPNQPPNQPRNQPESSPRHARAAHHRPGAPPETWELRSSPQRNRADNFRARHTICVDAGAHASLKLSIKLRVLEERTAAMAKKKAAKKTTKKATKKKAAKKKK
jgi:hypothetical protein